MLIFSSNGKTESKNNKYNFIFIRHIFPILTKFTEECLEGHLCSINCFIYSKDHICSAWSPVHIYITYVCVEVQKDAILTPIIIHFCK